MRLKEIHTIAFRTWKRAQHRTVLATRADLEAWLALWGHPSGAAARVSPTAQAPARGWYAERRAAGGASVVTCSFLRLVVRGMEIPYDRVPDPGAAHRDLAASARAEYFDVFGHACGALRVESVILERRPAPMLVSRVVRAVAIAAPRTKRQKAVAVLARLAKRRRRRQRAIAPRPLPPLAPWLAPLSLADLRDTYRWSTPAYHEKLVAHCAAGARGGEPQPRFVLLMGVPGAGKNYVLRRSLQRNCVVVDTDYCMGMLPDYWRGMLALQERDRRTTDWMRMFREECHGIAEQLFAHALRERKHLVWNGTGKNLKRYLTLIARARKRGYTVELDVVWADPRAAAARVRRRASACGRTVPDAVFRRALRCVPANFAALQPAVDHARVWSNLEGTSPRVLWDKHQCPSPLGRRRRASLAA